MRRSVCSLVAFVFAAVFVEAPWLHVHHPSSDSDHYRREHLGLGPVHGHGHDVPMPGSRWNHRQSGRDGDAQFFGSVTCVPVAKTHVDLLATRVSTAGEPVLYRVVRQNALVVRVHGPPGLHSIPPRAPPA